MSVESTISSKGQITLPLEVRRRLGVRQGDKVEFTFDGQQTIVRPVRSLVNPLDKWVGVGAGHFKGEAELAAWEHEMRGRDDWDEKDLGS